MVFSSGEERFRGRAPGLCGKAGTEWCGSHDQTLLYSSFMVSILYTCSRTLVHRSVLIVMEREKNKKKAK